MEAPIYSGGEAVPMQPMQHIFTPIWLPSSPELTLDSPVPALDYNPLGFVPPPGPMRTAPKQQKVPIPRQTHVYDEHRRKRSKWACVTCRRKKMKCSGDSPICEQCQGTNSECVYEDAKRLRDQRALSELSDKVRRYEDLLREIQGEVDGKTRVRIQDTLNVSGFSILCW